MKTCKEMLFDEAVDYQDRRELYTHLSSIETYAKWLFGCAKTPEETKVLFDTALSLIDAQRVKQDAVFKEQELRDQIGLIEFEKIKKADEEPF